jgi:hypothetical protein
MLAARSGRATPRMAETPSGMVNSIGLQGPGIDAFLERDLPWLADHGARAVVSIAGGSVEEYTLLAQRLRGRPLAMVEVNISCPNVEDRGQVFACDPRAASAVVDAVRRNTSSGVPVFAKLSPDVTDITAVAEACVGAGADGLSVINTLLGMVIDTTTMRPGARRGHRRAVRSGDPPRRRAVRLAGPSGPAGRPGARHGRHPHRPGRAGVPAGRGERRERRHHRLRRPDGAGAGAARARAGARRPRRRPGRRRRRAGPPAARAPRAGGPGPPGDELDEAVRELEEELS